MSLIVLYLGTRYNVCEGNCLRHMTISLFFRDLWPSPVTFIVRQGHFQWYYEMNVILLCIGSKYEVCRFNRIWHMDNYFGENLNDVIMTSSPIWILWNLHTIRPMYLISFWSNIKELRYKVLKLTENYEEEKNGYYVTVTLTFDTRSSNSIGSEPVR